MINVTDKFLMVTGETYRITHYPSTTLANPTDKPIKVLGAVSREYSVIETIPANSAVTTTLTVNYLKLDSDDEGAMVYVISATGSHYNAPRSQGNNQGGNTPFPISKAELEQMKASLTAMQTQVSKVGDIENAIKNNTANIQSMSSQVVKVSALESQLDSTRSTLNELTALERLQTYNHVISTTDYMDNVFTRRDQGRNPLLVGTYSGSVWSNASQDDYDRASTEAQDLIFRLAGMNYYKLNLDDGWLDLSKFTKWDFENTHKATRTLTNAFKVAADLQLNLRLPKDMTMFISEPIYLDQGLKIIDGNGCTLLFTTGSKTGGFITTDKNTGNSSRKIGGGFTLKNLTIKAYSDKDTGVFGFYGRNTSHVTLENLNITTVGQEPILFLIQPDNDSELYLNSTGNNKVINCNVKYDNKRANSYQANGIFFNVDLRSIIGTNADGSAKGMDVYIKEREATFDGTFPQPQYRHTNPTVIGCTVDGSRYGIAGFYCENGVFKDNTIRNNVRGLVLQNVSHHMQLIDNRVFDNKSSALLVNYGCYQNLIQGNTLVSDKAVGQAFLHTSVFCNNNTFRGNTCMATTRSANANDYPMWGIYVGVACSNVTIDNNHVSGMFRKALLAIESEWVNGDTATESYGSNVNASDPKYPSVWSGHVGMTNVYVSNNVFRQQARPYTAIYIKSNQGVGLENITLVNNIVSAVDGMRLRIFDVTNMTMGGNNYDSELANKYAIGAKSMYKLVTPDLGRPKVSWEQTAGSTPNQGAILAELPINAGKFTAPTANNSVVFLSGTGNLDGINGGSRGQIMSVRWANGITVTNTSSLRLMGGKPAASQLNSNMISTFMCLAPNVWTETTRNFA